MATPRGTVGTSSDCFFSYLKSMKRENLEAELSPRDPLSVVIIYHIALVIC